MGYIVLMAMLQSVRNKRAKFIPSKKSKMNSLRISRMRMILTILWDLDEQSWVDKGQLQANQQSASPK